jgi:hypothetical protein
LNAQISPMIELQPIQSSHAGDSAGVISPAGFTEILWD